jgi:general secretion pathway protein J
MKRAAGFTLVELLVALSMMALMAGLSWGGLAGMARVQAETDARADQMLALQIGLAQWGTDLDALAQLPQTTALEWDGRVLRMTRRGTAGFMDSLYVVAWTERQGRWLRWQSPPLRTRGEMTAAWQQAGLWSQNPGDEQRRFEVAIAPLKAWQLFYFRGNAWTHPLSSDAAAVGLAPAPDTAAGDGSLRTAIVPDGVRLVLMLPQGPGLAGRIVRDWVSPKLGGGPS